MNEHQLAATILILANREGTQSAIDWLSRMSQKRSAPMRSMIGVHALTINEAIEIDGCKFVPIEDLKGSRAVSKWRSRSLQAGQLSSAEVVACLDDFCPDIYSKDIDEQKFTFQAEWREKLSVILNAVGYALNGSPSLGEMFHEYLDEDVELLEHLAGYSWQQENAPRQITPVTLTSAAVDAAERHLAATGQFRRQLDLAAGRLALARRRVGDADRAIDISIALEALLGDTKKFDMTYKLGLRAARLLSGERSERMVIRDKVKKFYDIRSGIVHGSIPSLKAEQSNVIKEVGLYCNSLILKIAQSGEIPDWDEVEL